MNILLLSMPDSSEHTPTVSMRMPNGALSSLAGNIDPHHRIAVADLILVARRIRATVEELMERIQPDLVSNVRVAVGGYDPSMAPEAYTEDSANFVDFVVRGEGETTFRELLRALESENRYERILGLSFREQGRFRHNPDRPVNKLNGDEIRLPNRNARVLRPQKASRT